MNKTEFEKENIDIFMERILELLRELKSEITEMRKSQKRDPVRIDELLDNSDLCTLLKASKRTLQRHRSNGKLKYYIINHKIYYKLEDVHEFIRYHFEK
jgi:hypothetical protein